MDEPVLNTITFVCLPFLNFITLIFALRLDRRKQLHEQTDIVLIIGYEFISLFLNFFYMERVGDEDVKQLMSINICLLIFELCFSISCKIGREPLSHFIFIWILFIVTFAFISFYLSMVTSLVYFEVFKF